MKRTYIRDLKRFIEKKVSICASVNVRRDQGKMVFLNLGTEQEMCKESFFQATLRR